MTSWWSALDPSSLAGARCRSADRRVLPVSDWNDEWLTGGTEPDVIAEAHLDPESVFQGVKRFALDHDSRISRQVRLLGV